MHATLVLPCITSARKLCTNFPILNEYEHQQCCQLGCYLSLKAEDLLVSALMQTCFISITPQRVLIRGSALFTLRVCVHRRGV